MKAVVEFIETREKLPELEKRTGSGLIEVQETSIVVPATLARPERSRPLPGKSGHHRAPNARQPSFWVWPGWPKTQHSA
jgi:hypothetical protein